MGYAHAEDGGRDEEVANKGKEAGEDYGEEKTAERGGEGMSKEHDQNILLHQRPCLTEEEHSFGYCMSQRRYSRHLGLVAGWSFCKHWLSSSQLSIILLPEKYMQLYIHNETRNSHSNLNFKAREEIKERLGALGIHQLISCVDNVKKSMDHHSTLTFVFTVLS